MKGKGKLFLFAGLAIFLLSSTSWADTLYLRNGKKITGKIIQEEARSVSIMVNGIPFKYFRDEIKNIEKDKVPLLGDELEAKDLRKFSDIPKKKRDLIYRLFEANRARQAIARIFAEVITRIPRENRDYYERLLQIDQVLNRIVPVYDKYYTQEEIIDLLNFYSSSTGKKAIDVTPKIMKDTLGQTVTYFEEKVPGLKASAPPAANRR